MQESTDQIDPTDQQKLAEPSAIEKFRVLIVEDQEMPRQLFEAIIAGSGRYELVKSIRSADMADFVCGYCKVDLILMDVLTELGASGLNAAGRIKKKFPSIRIIIVTSMPEVSWIRRAETLASTASGIRR